VELPAPVSSMGALAVGALMGVVGWRGRRRVHRASEATPSEPSIVRAPKGHPPRARRLVTLGLVVMTLLVGAGVLLRLTHRDGRLLVTALDVGQGDSILVEGPRGGRLLLDGGPDPDRLLTVLDRHVPPWDRRIDLVVLTHPHEDHVAGLAMLLARYRIAGIAENGMLGAGPGDDAFRERLATMGVTTGRLAAGDRLALDGIQAVIRWPLRGEVPDRAPSEGRRVNDTSIVLDLWFGERRFLLTGDIEDDVDPRLLAAGIDVAGRRLDVLKVAHHGSGTATSDAWLDALRPRVALVSAGTGNPYGHPAPRTIERLEAHGARVLRTDLDGDLEVSTDGRDLRIATSGGRASTTATVAVARRLPPATTLARSAFLCAIPLDAADLATLDHGDRPHPPSGRPRPLDDPPSGPEVPLSSDPLAPCDDRIADDAHAGRGPAVVLASSGGWAPGARAGHGRRGVRGGRREARGPPGAVTWAVSRPPPIDGPSGVIGETA
jgi:competence protein ComEC